MHSTFRFLPSSLVETVIETAADNIELLIWIFDFVCFGITMHGKTMVSVKIVNIYMLSNLSSNLSVE